MCGGCRTKATRVDEYLQCTQCKAVRYCSKACQRTDWKKGGKAPFAQYGPHKLWCPILKAANEEFKSSEDKGVSLRKYFKWADQHHPKVGSFFEFEHLIRLGLYKRTATSFWSAPSPMAGPFNNMPTGQNPLLSMLGGSQQSETFQNGSMLLRSKFPTLQYGWVNLKKGEFPTDKPPSDKKTGVINNWKEYMEFRGLSPTSVAPLLLHNVLTVYQMLIELGIQSGKKCIYLLGTEIELNMIPLFGELAYLMPDIDLLIVMISPTVKQICDKAKDHPNSLITKSPALDGNKHPVVYENNPANFGSIRIALEPTKEYLHDLDGLPKCQAVMGLNAGIEAYPSWHQTLLLLVKCDIPFVFSDHNVISIESIKKTHIPRIHSNNSTDFRPLGFESKLNPFHCPVTRDIGVMVLPNINNGYLLTWRGQKGDPKKSAKEYIVEYGKAHIL